MGRYIAGIFKAVIFAIIGVIVIGVVTYISSCYAMDSKVKSIKNSMMDNISKNNYLTADSYKMYSKLLTDLKNSNPNLIESISINYGSDAVARDGFSIPSDANLDLSTPRNEGDTQVLQIKIVVRRDVWGSKSNDGAITTASDLEHGWSRYPFYYEALIPCNRYIK